MKKIILNIGALFVVLSSMVWSCDGYLDQFNMDKLSEEAEISPSFAAPVAYGNFSIQDILEAVNDSSGLISQTEDSLLYIYFSETAFAFEAGEFLEVPDQPAVDFQFKLGDEVDALSGINFNLWGSLLEGQEYTFQNYEKIEFSTEASDRIDSIVLNSGSLNLELYSELSHDGTINIQSSSIIDSDGNQLDTVYTISDQSGNYDVTEVVDLAGYSLIMSHNNDSTFVDLAFSLTFTLSSAGISADEKVGIKVSISNIGFDAIYGFIGEREVANMEESIDLDFFNNIDGLPEFYFADPQFSLSVHNSYGVPLSLNILNLGARSATDGTYTSLEFTDDNNIFQVLAPTIDQLGETVTSEWNINTETSNIDELISNVPDRIDISFLATIGSPEGATEQNFFLRNSKMEMETEVILPLWFSTSGYTLQDTLDIDLSEIMSNVSFIEGLELRLTTINEWPLGLSAQIHFIDASDVIVASLFDEQKALISAAPVDAATGELDEAVLEPYVLSVMLDGDDLNGMDDATRMMLEITVATSTTTEGNFVPVKFLSNYMLNYQVSLGVDFRVNPLELDF
ncbi:MAG: hypothetical protein WD577_10770 [Bacteroidales bacterium]